MPVSVPSPSRIRFHDFLLDLTSGELHKDGQRVALPPKAFEVLRALVESPGQVVTREQLRKRLWAADTFVEFDDSLNHAVKKLRQALGDSSDAPQFIETLPRYGYRLIVPVDAGRTPELEPTPRRRTVAKSAVLGAVLAVVAALLLAFNVREWRSRNEVAHAITGKMWTGGSFWWFRARTPIKPPSTLSIKRLTTSGMAELAAISPDGKYLVYTENDGNKQNLWLQQMASGTRTALLPPAPAEYGAVRFSADSNYIFYTRKNGKGSADLYQIAAIGGAPRKLLVDVSKEFAVSPDGRSFAHLRSGWPEKETVLLVKTSDGDPEKTVATWPKSILLREIVAWSPDGKLLATVQVSKTSVSLVAVPVDGGPEIKLFSSDSWRDIYTPQWLPDGSGLIAPVYEKATQLWEFPYPAGQPRQITRLTTRYDQVSLTADSRALVAVEETNRSGIWVGPATEPDRVRRVTPPGARTVGAIGLAWTPDGRVIYWSNDRDQSDFMSMSADGSDAQRLALDGLKWFPNVCPDGHTLLFMAPDPITAEDVVMRADLDRGQPHAIKETNVWGFIHCTPDGKWVVYSSGFGKKLQKVPIEGGKPIELADRTCIPSALSPDGRWIACHYLPEEGAPKLAIIPFAGGAPVKVLDLPSTVVCLHQSGRSNKGFLTPFSWTPDGRAVVFADNRDGVGNLWAQPIAGGAAVKLTHFTAEDISYFAFSRDGRQIALARGTSTDDAVLITNFR